MAETNVEEKLNNIQENNNSTEVNDVNNENPQTNEGKEAANEQNKNNEPQKVYFGPPRREEVVPEWTPDNPLFMTEFPDEANEHLAALKTLAEDETPEEKVRTYRENGNDAFALGTKPALQDAVVWYSKAIEENIKDDELNSILYSNRAMVNLKLENYGKVIEDCKKAIELNKNSIKSYYRAAQACFSLLKYETAIEFCKSGLEIEKSPALSKILKDSTQKLAIQKEKERKKREELEKVEVLESSLQDAIKERKLVIGKPLFKYQKQQYDGVLRWSDDTKTELSWPVLFLYPEYAQSDFIQSFRDLDTFDEHLEIMFPPNEYPEWDLKNQYTHKKLSIYFLTNSTDILDEGTNYKKRRWVKFNTSSTLLEVLQTEGHVIPRFPVFHLFIKGSAYESEYLSKSENAQD